MTTASVRSAAVQTGTIYAILFAISSVHLMNDTMQAVVAALFPILQKSLTLSYGQIGWIAFTLNMTSSIMQPLVGYFSDKRPAPWMLPVGMGLSLIGMAGLAFAPGFWFVLLAVVFVGLGSAIFHPEGSRVVYFAAGGRRGLAQSIYQVGGNAGSSLAPLMTIFLFVPLGQSGAIWGTLLAASAILILLRVVPWYREQLEQHGKPVKRAANKASATSENKLSRSTVTMALTILVLLVFGRSWYMSGISTFYQFFAENKYGLSVREAQVPIFLFMAAGVLGTFFGGVMADRIGRKRMIALSMGCATPFALILPHLPLMWIYPVTFILGFVLLSGYSVSVVYAQELLPGKVGMASGLITGLAFGMGALGAVVLGKLAEAWGLDQMMTSSSFLPIIGILSFLLPPDRRDAA
ncbi:FSR family fosmidomycin resistance protein-like MFS transporter [Paenibacillus taihuensis]|uniref:FSR family fosmidomycin resistance protein-like MFS transporter n=1 Tax=Paenibacillus taihuensis TaxID=1156355 RepID=A0A3D9QWN0_9BACL|nr:MFS transporter [Paenibacillus taihuensis]REE70475.1 FSR family fosmidomycin resistance protein-like MFS transporter [Paenibacillus taihuensis]